MTYQPQTKRK